MTTPTEHEISFEELHRILARWQHDGLLDAGEVARIEAAEAARAAPVPAVAEPMVAPAVAGPMVAPAVAGPMVAPAVAGPVVAPVHVAGRPTGSLIAEGLGYAGAALLIAAVARLVGQNWSDLSFGVQVSLAATAAAALLAAGFAVPERLAAPGRRLRAVLWAGSTGLAFATWAMTADRGFGWHAREVVLFAAALTTVQALLLWPRSRHLPQHLVAFASITALVSVLSTYLPGVHDHPAASVAVVCVGVAWVLLGQLGVVQPQLAAYLVGSLAAVMGAQSTTGWRWGAVFALIVAAGVIAFAVWLHSLPLLGVGTYALLTSVISAADRFFPGSTGITVALMVAGAVLVGCGLWITRRGRASMG
jgi:hypothetical protein